MARAGKQEFSLTSITLVPSNRKVNTYHRRLRCTDSIQNRHNKMTVLNHELFNKVSIANLAIVVRRYTHLRSVDCRNRERLLAAIEGLDEEMLSRVISDVERLVNEGQQKVQEA